MGRVIIKEPMREGFIGLNEKRIADPELIIEISATNKKGERVWPYKYRLNREKIGSYRTWTVKGVKLTLVPLRDLIRITE
jgi:hypothetical protein